jgi:hypothetical protein
VVVSGGAERGLELDTHSGNFFTELLDGNFIRLPMLTGGMVAEQWKINTLYQVVRSKTSEFAGVLAQSGYRHAGTQESKHAAIVEAHAPEP